MVSTQSPKAAPAPRERLTPKVILRKSRTARTKLQELLKYYARRRRLLKRLHQGKPTDLWIGDSHARFFVCPEPMPPHPTLTEASEDTYVWHGGPRVVWSLAKNGFVEAIHKDAERVGKANRSDALTLIVVFGEVDVRCHLGPRIEEPGFNLDHVDVYLDLISELGEKMKAALVLASVPVPQGREYASHEMFPIAGTIDQRREAFRLHREALHRASANDDRPGRRVPVRILDATDDWVDEPGLLRRSFSFDDCHVTKEGAAYIVARLQALQAEHLPARR